MLARSSAAAFVLLGCLAPAIALGQPAQVAGRVSDPSGLPIADAIVTVSGERLGFPLRASTSRAGEYRVGGLPAGTYRVSVEREGFRRREWPDVRVGEGRPTILDAPLEADRPAPGEGAPTWTAAPAAGRRIGANRFSGNSWSTLADHRLQSMNLTAEAAAEGAGFGNPVRRATELGLEAGGPLWPGRAWVTASVERADTNAGVIGFYTAACTLPDGQPVAGAALKVDCLHADVTRQEHATVRLLHEWNAAHRSTLLWGQSATRRPARGASAYSRLEHTNRQTDLGRAQPLRLQHEAAISDRLLFDARFTFSDASFVLDFHEPALAVVQGAYDRYTLVNWRSGLRTEHRRPTTQASATVTRSWPGAGAGRHEASAGVEVLDRTSRRIDRTGGGAVAVFDSRGGARLPYQARLVRDGETSHWERRWSAFFQQSYVRGAVSIEAGLRLDVQDDRARHAAIPANPVLPDLLPEVRFAGADSGAVYRDLSPRLSVTWDPGSNGRTSVRAGLARSRASGNTSSVPLQATGQTRLVYWWDDLDGDGFVSREELDLLRGPAATPTANYDPVNPAAVRTPASVDPGLRNVATEELTLTVERGLTRRLTVRAAYTARRIRGLQASYPLNADGSPVASATFHPVKWVPESCPAGASCPAVTYYERDDPLPARTLLRNDGRFGRQDAVEVALHKRHAQGWMLDVAASWRRARWFFPEATRDYTDPTNLEMRHGTEYSMPGPRWTATLRGSLRFPLDLDAAATIEARGGLPDARVVSTPNRGALGSASVLVERYGSRRYPAVRTLDCRFERKFTLGRIVVAPSVNVFNVANAGTVLRRNATQNSRSANAITRILPPRSLRLDLRVSW